jgi:hypothetical protein
MLRHAAHSSLFVAAACCAVLGAALGAACSGGPKADPDDYFPLAAGHAWTYRMTTTRDDDVAKPEVFTINARAAENMGGDPAHRRHTSDGTDYWLRSDKTGIYRIAVRTPLDLNALVDEPHRYVLQKPYQPGTSWQATTTAYVLQRRSEVPKEIRRTHKPFPMTYTIAAMDEKLVAPAGTFERCMRVEGKAAVRLYVDAQFAWRDIPLTTQEWYCPGVGLAKVERTEPSPSRFMVGGKVAMELVEWR